MTAPLGRAAPLRFHIGLLLCWTLSRIVMLADWSGGKAEPVRTRREAGSRPVASPSAARLRPSLSRHSALLDPAALLPGRARADSVSEGRSVARLMLATQQSSPRLPLATVPRACDGRRGCPDGANAGLDAAAVLVVPGNATRSRWSGSAWAFVRGGGRTTALAPVDQIGGGQGGARLLYRLDAPGRLAASARVSRTIGGIRQTEAAIGLDWTPIARLPLHVMADRRIAIDKGGRSAWTLGIAGGVYALRLPARWRLDGYGEAGVVGSRRRDLYADGAVRIARAIDLGGGVTLAPGGGLWGAAQPGAERLDVGPSAVLRLPVVGHAMSVALDWRERVAGGARPGSGVALTVAMDL
jgi:hypothetical protein